MKNQGSVESVSIQRATYYSQLETVQMEISRFGNTIEIHRISFPISWRAVVLGQPGCQDIIAKS